MTHAIDQQQHFIRNHGTDQELASRRALAHLRQLQLRCRLVAMEKSPTMNSQRKSRRPATMHADRPSLVHGAA